MNAAENLTWQDVLGKEKEEPYFVDTMNFVRDARKNGVIIYPEHQNIFHAFKVTPFEKIKVVILGQDPYHGPNQAHGLAFSVQQGVRTPPSLQNIYKAIQYDYPNFQIPNHGFLDSWAEQGVMLLNAVLTVEAGQAGSHANLGWERFTDFVIQSISQHKSGVVFLLWGSFAQKKIPLIDQSKHTILKSVHPSPLSAHRGFLTCGHFKKANECLAEKALNQINWQL